MKNRQPPRIQPGASDLFSVSALPPELWPPSDSQPSQPQCHSVCAIRILLEILTCTLTCSCKCWDLKFLSKLTQDCFLLLKYLFRASLNCLISSNTSCSMQYTHMYSHTCTCTYMYMRKGLVVYIENCEKPAATRTGGSDFSRQCFTT